MSNQCDKCHYFKDVFGNFVQCVKTGRFVDYEYWHNIHPEDCPRNHAEFNGPKHDNHGAEKDMGRSIKINL